MGKQIVSAGGPRAQGAAVTEGVLRRSAGTLGTPSVSFADSSLGEGALPPAGGTGVAPSVSLRLTAPSEREPLDAVNGRLFTCSITQTRS